MTNLLAGIADYLADNIDDLVWNPTAAYTGDDIGLYLYRLPYDRDKAVGLYLSTGEQSSPRLSYDAPSVQIRIRGDLDVVAVSSLAQDIYDQMHNLTATTLADGTYVIVAVCEQSGANYIGTDDNQRPEFTVNVRVNVINVTPHREVPIT
jgi:hypothetical protein